MAHSGYDLLAKEYYDIGHKTSRNFDQITTYALKHTGIPQIGEGLVLELGCGKGRCGEYLGIEPTKVIQLDASKEMLEITPREDCLLRIHADACSIPLVKEQFSAVMGFLIDPFIGFEAFSETFRMLKPGGLFLATVPTIEWGVTLRKNIDIDPRSTRFLLIETGEKVILPSTLFPTQQIIDMLEHTGFYEIRVTPQYLPNNIFEISKDISKVAELMHVDVHKIPIINLIVARKP